MARRVNVPELLDPLDYHPKSLEWDFGSECYPHKIVAGLVVQNHPDPFSDSGNRVCHHAGVHLAGLGIVDLGWTVTGEPPPDDPIAGVHLDPRFTMTMQDGFTEDIKQQVRRGKPLTNKIWRTVLGLVRMTMIGVAVRVVESSTRHAATARFLEASHEAVYHECGMMVGWKRYSVVDLRTCGLL